MYGFVVDESFFCGEFERFSKENFNNLFMNLIVFVKNIIH